MSTTKKKGLDVCGIQPKQVLSGVDGRNSIGKSTATGAQHHRIMQLLHTGEKSTFDFHRAGIVAPSARIKELPLRHTNVSWGLLRGFEVHYEKHKSHR